MLLSWDFTFDTIHHPVRLPTVFFHLIIHQIILQNTKSLEQVILHGEGEFNLDAIKEIQVTQSFLGLEPNVRGCQSREPFYNCTTRHYIDQFLRDFRAGCWSCTIGTKRKSFTMQCQCRILGLLSDGWIVYLFH